MFLRAILATKMSGYHVPKFIASVRSSRNNFKKKLFTFEGGPVFPLRPLGILAEWISPFLCRRQVFRPLLASTSASGFTSTNMLPSFSASNAAYLYTRVLRTASSPHCPACRQVSRLFSQLPYQTVCSPVRWPPNKRACQEVSRLMLLLA